MTHPVSLSPVKKKDAERAEIEAQLAVWLGNNNTITEVPSGQGTSMPGEFANVISTKDKK